MQLTDIIPGNTYACRFKTTTFVNKNGTAVNASVNIGESHPGTPGEYQGVGIIQLRDTVNKLVKVYDTTCNQEFVVAFDACWDVDIAEIVDEVT